MKLEKPQQRDRGLYIGIVLLAAAVLVTAAVLFSILLKYDRDATDRGKLFPIAIEGEYSEEGGTWRKLTKETKFENWDLRDIRVRGHFTRDLPKGSSLFMNIDHMWVALSVNGREIYRLAPDEGDGNPTRALGKQWITIESPGISREDVVELKFGNLYWNAYMIQFDELLWHMHTGNERLMLFEAVREDGWTFAIGTIFLFLTLFLLIIALCCGMLRVKGALKFLWLGITTLFSSFWFYTLTPAITLFLPWPVSLNVFYAFSMQGMAISVILFVLCNVSGWRKTSILICEGILLLSLFIGLINQILSIQDLYSAINYFSILDLVAAICIVISLGYEAFRLKKVESMDLLKAMLPLVMCAVIELINGYIQFFVASVLLGVGLILFAVTEGVYIILRFKRSMENEKRALVLENELNQSQISIMLSQIQPHFLYNALNTIQFLCRTNPQKAVEAVADFSDYLRGNMDSLTRRNTIPLERELGHLNNYLNIEKLRFPNINIIYVLDTLNFSIPALTLQPLVENAIRHGVTQREEGGTITISSWEDDKAWYLQVKDDGVGFAADGIPDDGRSHVGIKNTRSRLWAMCRGTLEIQSVLSKGTCVNISIPKERKPDEGNSC